MHLQREDDTDEAVQSDDCQREDRQLAGEGRDEAREATEVRRAPRPVVDNVDSAIIRVDNCDDEEVHAHEEVSQSEVSDEERVNL